MKSGKLALGFLALLALIAPSASQSAPSLPKQDDQVQQCIQGCRDDWDFRQQDCRDTFIIDTSMGDYYSCVTQNSITYQYCKHDCES
jgi:hypothetical protein